MFCVSKVIAGIDMLDREMASLVRDGFVIEEQIPVAPVKLYDHLGDRLPRRVDNGPLYDTGSTGDTHGKALHSLPPLARDHLDLHGDESLHSWNPLHESRGV